MRLRAQGSLSLCGCTVMTAAIVAVVVAAIVGWVAVRLWKDLTGPPYGSDGPSSGWSAVWLDDLDEDGVCDLALRCGYEPAADPDFAWGVTRILSGASGQELATLRRAARSAPLRWLVGPAGDVDGDGCSELWWLGGLAELHVGSPRGEREVLSLGVDMCAFVTRLGDLDGDRAEDLLVGAFPVQQGGTRVVSAVSGGTGHVLWTVTDPATGAPVDIGCIAPAIGIGDVDGDTFDDLAVVDAGGQVLLVDGRRGEVLRGLPLQVDGSGALEPLGDLDGDGAPDLLHHQGHLSYEEWDSAGDGRPVQVVSTRDGSVLRSFPVGRYTGGVFSPGDVDGDGHLDVAWHRLGFEGDLVVVSAIDGKTLHRIDGAFAEPGRGDWDGDGCADLLVTRNVYWDTADEAPADLWRKGRVEVVSGRDGSTLRGFDEGVLPPDED